MTDVDPKRRNEALRTIARNSRDPVFMGRVRDLVDQADRVAKAEAGWPDGKPLL